MRISQIAGTAAQTISAGATALFQQCDQKIVAVASIALGMMAIAYSSRDRIVHASSKVNVLRVLCAGVALGAFVQGKTLVGAALIVLNQASLWFTTSPVEKVSIEIRRRWEQFKPQGTRVQQSMIRLATRYDFLRSEMEWIEKHIPGKDLPIDSSDIDQMSQELLVRRVFFDLANDSLVFVYRKIRGQNLSDFDNQMRSVSPQSLLFPQDDLYQAISDGGIFSEIVAPHLKQVGPDKRLDCLNSIVAIAALQARYLVLREESDSYVQGAIKAVNDALKRDYEGEPVAEEERLNIVPRLRECVSVGSEINTLAEEIYSARRKET